MYRAIPLVLLVSVLLAVGAAVQVPPKYEIIQVTENAYFEPEARLNNLGQFVFMAWFDVTDRRTEEIFLYDNGELIRLTNDYVQDVAPDINDAGQIVWARGVGPVDPETGEPTLEIVMCDSQGYHQLTDNDVQDWGPSINSLGQVVWTRCMGAGCGGQRMDIFFYDGADVHRITTDGLSDNLANQTPEIDDLGTIVWTRYDFCVDPWESTIMMYSGDVTTQLSGAESYQPTAPDINNVGQIVWQTNVPGPNKGVVFCEGGTPTLFTDSGGGPRLNDHGDITFFRWYENESTYQQWLYRAGTFYQLSDDWFWNVSGDINNAGEVVWSSGRYPWSDIRYLRQAKPKDLDGVSKVNATSSGPWTP